MKLLFFCKRIRQFLWVSGVWKYPFTGMFLCGENWHMTEWINPLWKEGKRDVTSISIYTGPECVPLYGTPLAMPKDGVCTLVDVTSNF